MHEDPRRFDPRQHNFDGFREISELAEANKLLENLYEEVQANKKANLLHAQRWWVRLLCFLGFHGVNPNRFIRRHAYYAFQTYDAGYYSEQICPYCNRAGRDPLASTPFFHDRGDGPPAGD